MARIRLSLRDIPDSQIPKIQALMRAFIGLRIKGTMDLQGFVSFSTLQTVSPGGEMGRMK
jgi:hypothetical protein